MDLRELGEFGLIARITARLERAGARPRGLLAGGEARRGVVVGSGDDAAVLEVPAGQQVVATCDGLVEGVHFRLDWCSPRDVGHKALAVNLSDLAAMGAEPWVAVVSLFLPGEATLATVDGLVDGLGALAAAAGLAVVGGNISASSGGLALDVTALGLVDAGRATLRSGARPGDLLLVTGELGAAAAGLQLLEAWGGTRPAGGLLDAVAESLVQAQLTPVPRVREALAAAATGAVRAAIDLSDGLAADLGHLTEASGVGAVVRQDDLPVPEALWRAADLLSVDAMDWVLHGGEDYQLLLAVEPGGAGRGMKAVGDATGTPVTVIGRVVERPGLWLETEEGRLRNLARRGHDHLAPTARDAGESRAPGEGDRRLQ